MSQVLYSCPQCGGGFDLRDGYPDLYDLKLCSPYCQELWLVSHQYRSSLQDPQLVQNCDVDLVQIGEDIQTSPDTGDPNGLDSLHKQMG